MNAIENRTFTDKIIDGLKSAVNEIEDLRVQRALGMAEARDLFDQQKKKLRTQLRSIKDSIENFNSSEENTKFLNHLEFLEVQLNLGLAETKEMFEYQRKRILVALRKLEVLTKDKINVQEQFAFLHFEIEKFKIKMELMSLQFHLKKITLQYNFDQRRHAFIQKLRNIKERMQESDFGNKLTNFREEVLEAFDELKKAII